MPACKTLEFTSSSLSFGNANVSVQILPRDSNRAPRISWNVGGRHLYRTDHLKLFDSLDFEVRRTTIYRGESAALATPEHLAPVFLLWPEKSFDVDVGDGTKIASCDGANPVPEIEPDDALEAGAAVVGTGRSDHPNQINNVMCFPGLFRGALDVRARDINEAMKQAASYALADLVAPEELTAQYILPVAFDKRIGPAVAAAVAKAARESGVARL